MERVILEQGREGSLTTIRVEREEEEFVKSLLGVTVPQCGDSADSEISES